MSASMDAQKCVTCKFFRKIQNLSIGECHRHAPRPAVGDTRRSVGWPAVPDHVWCGEWEKRT